MNKKVSTSVSYEQDGLRVFISGESVALHAPGVKALDISLNDLQFLAVAYQDYMKK